MKDYVEENNRVLKEWEERIRANEEESNFAPDGILYRGEPYDEFGYCEFDANKDLENQLWSEAPLRYLFITKDQNAGGGEAWDVRGETGRKYKDSKNIPYRFYRNMMYILYGLIHSKKEICGYDNFTNEQAINEYDRVPLARINVKKQAGGSSIDNSTLKRYIEDYKDLLIKQIELLDADILICCGYSDSEEDTGNIILNFLKNNIYSFKQFDNWIYFEEGNGYIKRIAINAWHLSYNGVSQRDFYEGVISSYHKFVKLHPDFIESHRKKSNLKQILK